jgi:hypothetical protein
MVGTFSGIDNIILVQALTQVYKWTDTFLISDFRRVLNDEEYILHPAFEDGPDRGFRNVGKT